MNEDSALQSEGQDDVRPIVVVSQCLGFAAVRYNGMILRDDFVEGLQKHVRFVQVCPEVGMGLGVPRDPIRIVSTGGNRRLVQPATQRDVTEEMHTFADSFLGNLDPVDGFILKSRSPSCGIKDVKVFAQSEAASPAVDKGPGLFAEAVLHRFPLAAIEDEGRLTNSRLRHHFLVRLFSLARFRQARASGTIADLVRFHTEYKLQLMAYSQLGLRELGRIVASAKAGALKEAFDKYVSTLSQIMAQLARPGSVRNALMHAFGYVSASLTSGEKKYFLGLLDDYREERLPLSALLSVLRAWVVRFEQKYLECQRLFDPYPRALMDLTDSSAGKT